MCAGFLALPVMNASLADGLRRQPIPDRSVSVVRHPPALRMIQGAPAEQAVGVAASAAAVCVSAEAVGGAEAAGSAVDAAATDCRPRAENASTAGNAAVPVAAGATAAIPDSVRAAGQAVDRSPAETRRAVPPRHGTAVDIRHGADNIESKSERFSTPKYKYHWKTKRQTFICRSRLYIYIYP